MDVVHRFPSEACSSGPTPNFFAEGSVSDQHALDRACQRADSERHRVIGGPIQGMQHGVGPRRRRPEHAATQAFATTVGREKSEGGGGPVQIAVGPRDDVVGKPARRTTRAEGLQNLKAGAGLADLENGPSAGRGRSARARYAVQEAVSSFRQRGGVATLVEESGSGVALKGV